ncbi:hypothetical protein ACHAPE_006608 [Trichoderma viride]
MLDLSRCLLIESDDTSSDDEPNVIPKRKAPTTRQNNQSKKRKQDSDATMAADEGAATAIEVTTAASASASLSSTEIQEMLKEKEEFSLLAKEKISGVANYKESLRSALLKVEDVKAEHQSLRATTQEAHLLLHGRLADVNQVLEVQKQVIMNSIQRLGELEAGNYDSNENAIFKMIKRLESNEKAIIDLTQRLEAAEAENSRLRARADTQKDINKDVKAAMRNLQHGMATFARGA